MTNNLMQLLRPLIQIMYTNCIGHRFLVEELTHLQRLKRMQVDVTNTASIMSPNSHAGSRPNIN